MQPVIFLRFIPRELQDEGHAYKLTTYRCSEFEETILTKTLADAQKQNHVPNQRKAL